MNDNKTNFFDDIERLRGFACILVLIQHFVWICPLRFMANVLQTDLLMWGEGGMRLFFAISGFVVTLSLMKKLDTVSGEQFIDRLRSARRILFSFYKNRFFRIFPVAFFMLLVLAIFLFSTEGDSKFLKGLIRCPIDVFCCTYNYSMGAFAGLERNHFCATGPLWTLAVEGQFYLLWPLILLMCKDHNARVITSLVMGCLFLFGIQPMSSFLWELDYYSTCNNLAELFLGSFFALIYEDGMGKNANKNVTMVFTALLALALWCYPSVIDREVYYSKMALTILSVTLVVSCTYVRGGFLNIPVLRNVFQYLGSRSYSFYVIQLLIASITVWYTNSIYFPKEGLSEYDFFMYQLIIAVASLFVLTEVVYRLLEKPMRNLGKK
ncbi:hypothetical protein FACS189472_00610 [Alphaproteobacteria bacterium]|nr:hypothetical protein FACS189472_00610 [Alphaproteobacteria bacterium]